MSTEIVLALTLVLIFSSYFQIYKQNDFTPILILILYSRIIVGYSSGHSVALYSILNLLVNYLPFIIYFSRSKYKPQNGYQYTQLYFVFCLISIILYSSWDSSTFSKRFLPLLFFIALLYKHIFLSEKSLLLTFKMLIIGSLFILISTDYSIMTVELLTGGYIFPTESDFQPLIEDLFRTMGPFFDPRIFGLILNIGLIIFLNQSVKSKLDYLFILGIVLLLLLTISRGSIVTGFILLLYPIWKSKGSLTFITITAVFIIIVFIYRNDLFMVFNSVFFTGGDNPLEQRSGFITTGLNLFIDWPLGYGYGFLSDLKFPIYVGDASYYFITDAFYSIQLVEMGFLGFGLFIASLFEIFLRNTKVIYIKLLGLGILLQLVGTDIPDFGMYYFVFLVLVRYLNTEKSLLLEDLSN